MGSVVYLAENKQTSSTQTPASTVTISKQLRNRKPAMLHTAQVNLSLKNASREKVTQLNRKYRRGGSRIE